MAENKSRRQFFNRKQEEKPRKKIYMYTIIVNYGYSGPVLDLLRRYESNAQFVCLGRGTASTEAKTIFGLENNGKDVIAAFVDEENVEDIRNALTVFFATNQKVMGFAYTIKLSSIVGEKVYHFLTNSL